MINSSTAFAGEIEKSSRSFDVKIYNDNLDVSGSIKSVAVHLGSCGGQTFMTGVIYASYIEVTLSEMVTALQGLELRLDVGVLVNDTYDYITLGYFTCGAPETSENQTSFTAQGRIGSKFEGTFIPPAGQTLSDIAAALTSQTGVSVTFAPEIDAAGEITGEMTGLTCRDALEILAGAVGGYATETATGSVWVGRYTDVATKIVDGDVMRDLPTSNDYDFTISGVRVIVSPEIENEDGSVTPAVYYEAGEDINVEIENEHMTESLFNQMSEALIGLTYRPSTVNLALGDPRVEATDVLQVEAGNLTIIVPCMSIVHTFDGGWQTQVIAPGPEEVGFILGATGRAVKAAYDKSIQAQTAAMRAVTAANGKNRIFHRASAPDPSVGLQTGDTWFDTDDGYKMYTWSGSSWTAETFGTNAISDLAVTNAKIADATIQSAKIAQLDAGKITTGDLSTINIQGPNENTFWNLSSGEWQSHGEEIAENDFRGISWLQKTDVNIKDGVLEVKGEHENVWDSYSDLVPTKKTSYMQAGIDETSIFDPTLVGGMEDVEPYGYAGIRLEGDTYRTFGLYKTTLSNSDERTDGRTREDVCYVRPYVTIGPEGMHFSCDFGDTFGAANHNYLKYALSDDTSTTPTEWTLRKAMIEYLKENTSEAENKYVWIMDDTGSSDPMYSYCDTVYDVTISPADNLDAAYVNYEAACTYAYGISSSTTAQPTEWMTEGEIWQYLSDHTTAANNKYVWARADYWWREDRYQYTYNKFLASEYQETYDIPNLSEALITPAYNDMDIAAGNSSMDSALLFNNRFKTVSETVSGEQVQHREYNEPDYEMAPDSAVWPYKPGDTVEWNDTMTFTGRFFNSRKDIKFIIPLTKPVSDYVQTATFTGYLQFINVNGTTLTVNADVPNNGVSILRCAPSPVGIDIWMRWSTAFSSGATNSACTIHFSNWGIIFS